MHRFIRASELSAEERNNGIKSGDLQPWRKDADGELWFKSKVYPEIRGIPRSQGESDAEDYAANFNDSFDQQIYARLVERAAAGEMDDRMVIADVLGDVNKSFDDFEADIQLAQEIEDVDED